MFDCIVIGAGFAGATIAERVANLFNQKVLVVEKREHIGGNCYDYYNEYGLLVHKYGPHIFHTNCKEVWDYISQFTKWILYQHKVLAYIDGKKISLPFNLNSLYALFTEKIATLFEEKLIKKYGYGSKIPVLKLINDEDKDLKMLGEFVYEKIFLNYTLKQWGLELKDLDPSVSERVPVYVSRDDRYFQDKYQGIPKEGYTRIFEKMLSNKNIKILLNTDFQEIIEIDYEKRKIYLLGKEFKGKVFYTGPIDEFFGYKYGVLPYRSLRFEYEVYKMKYYQDVAVINYPNDYDFTRITEYKHMTGQESEFTVIVKEYPENFGLNENLPFYPIPKEENYKILELYKAEVEKYENLFFIGRLAEYIYYNMDQVIKRALDLVKRIGL